MRGFTILLAGAALVAAPAAEARERLLAPTDEWRVQPMKESCALIRNFRDAEGDTLRLQMRAFGMAERFQLTMVGEALPLRKGRQRGAATFRYRFKPDPQWRESFGASGYVGGVDAISFLADLVRSDMAGKRASGEEKTSAPEGLPPLATSARAAEIREFALAYPARDDTVLQLGPMMEVLMELGECGLQQLRKLGYDPQRLASFRQGPTLANGREVGQAIVGRFVRDGLGHNEPVFLRADVDERGVATGCTIQHPDRGTEAEKEICRAIEDVGKFEPALDEGGNPAKAPYFTTVAFGIR